jgi:hypothetical protein
VSDFKAEGEGFSRQSRAFKVLIKLQQLHYYTAAF